MNTPRMLLTNCNVIEGFFSYHGNAICMTVQLHLAFILRHGDLVAVVDSHKGDEAVAYKITDFHLNEDNTVTLTAVRHKEKPLIDT